MNTEEQIQRVVKRLDAIAKANEDKFEHRITILDGGARFLFDCVETSDEHSFVTAIGPTIKQAVAVAETQIADALTEWSYEEKP